MKLVLLAPSCCGTGHTGCAKVFDRVWRLKAVLSGVIGRREHGEVRKPVVAPVAVDVMNVSIASKQSSDRLFDDKSVLQDISVPSVHWTREGMTWRPDVNVTVDSDAAGEEMVARAMVSRPMPSRVSLVESLVGATLRVRGGRDGRGLAAAAETLPVRRVVGWWDMTLAGHTL